MVSFWAGVGRNIDVTSRNVNVTSEISRNLELTSRKLDIASRNLDLASRNLDVTSRNLDIILRNLANRKELVNKRPFPFLQTWLYKMHQCAYAVTDNGLLVNPWVQ